MATNQKYDQAVTNCKDIFINKTKDYGTSWRVLRIISVVDQIFIKAQRIRTIQEKKNQKIGDDIISELRGIVNYGIIGLIQLEHQTDLPEEVSLAVVSDLYDQYIFKVKSVMMDKNHDYGEAWRDMTQESFIDLILVKLLRIKQIISNEGKTIISEGIDANFTDIVNYAVFGLILIEEGKHTS